MWLSHISTEQKETNSYVVKFAVDANSGRGSRFASVTFREKDGSLEHSIRVTQAAYYIGTRQEISAYRYLFTDDIYSQLRSDVTLDTINAIENLFIRRLATQLYEGNYPREFRVQSFRSYPHPDVQREQNGTSPWNLLDNATGIIVPTGDFVLFVGDIPQGQTVSLRIVDFFNTAGSQAYTNSTRQLTSGFNNILMNNSRGLAYIMYHTDDTLPQQPVDIHFVFGEINGYFDVTKHTKADWDRLINQANPNEHFDILGNYAHIVFPVVDFKTHTACPIRLMEVYDSIVWLQLEHTGLVKYGRTKKNRNLFEVSYNPSVYMAARSYVTVFHKNEMHHMCNVNNLRQGWGQPHEVGHMLQIPAFRWGGMTEVSVNVGSMLVQREFGVSSRLSYQRARQNIIDNRRPHAAWIDNEGVTRGNDVFEKLVPLWQLELYFAQAQGMKDFYPDLYERLRAFKRGERTDGEFQVNFVRMASDVAKRNLTEFFEAWGFLTPVDVEIDDYGARHINVTQAMIDEVKTHLLQYPKPAHTIQGIECGNWQSFR
jgi:hypothetical protein